MSDQASGLLSGWLRRKRFRAVRPYLSGRILDFGCGTGNLAAWVDRTCYTGVDIDPVVLSTARSNHPEYRFYSRIPEETQFDVITAMAVLEHVPAPQDLLRTFRASLASGGIIDLTTPHPRSRKVHDMGAVVGLFSSEAAEKHETFLDRKRIEELGVLAVLNVTTYRRFLLGMNQLVVMEQR